MEDAQLTRLAQRITDITNLRTVHHELCALLTVGEQLELRVSEMFAPFAHLTALAPTLAPTSGRVANVHPGPRVPYATVDFMSILTADREDASAIPAHFIATAFLAA